MSDDEEEDDDDVISEEEERQLLEKARKVAAKNNGSRRSVLCAEPLKKDENWKPPVYPKEPAQRKLIDEAVVNSFLFQSLRPEVREQVLDAFKGPVKMDKGSTVIIEGSGVEPDGPGLYVIESGILDACKAPAGCPEIRPGNVVFTYTKPGMVFGELALLYDCPRAASIVTASDSVLWSLDRETFNNLVKGASMEARQKMQANLSSVEILKGLTDNDRDKIIDAMRQRDYKPADKIITKGEVGEEFFILIEGEADAISDGKSVKAYTPGNFFGELALIKGQPRAVDVVARAPKGASCAVLSGDIFRKLLGPLDELQSAAGNYASLASKDGGAKNAAGGAFGKAAGADGTAKADGKLANSEQRVSKVAAPPAEMPGWSCCGCAMSDTKTKI